MKDRKCLEDIFLVSFWGQRYLFSRAIYIYMRVVLNSFIWKTSSSPKKNSFAELSRTPCFSFAVHVGQDFSEKRGCVISSNCSRRLIPRHTSFCGSCTWTFTFCFKMLVLAHLHRSVLTQQVHSLGHLAFKWRSSFAKALAKLSPNFRDKSPNSFYKMIHIYIITTKYKYLQCNLDMCTWTFAKTLARKKNYFAISEKNFSRDC